MALANLEQYRFHGAAFQSFFCARRASQQEKLLLHDLTEMLNIIDIGGVKMLWNEQSPKLISGCVICGVAVAMCGALAAICGADYAICGALTGMCGAYCLVDGAEASARAPCRRSAGPAPAVEIRPWRAY